MAFGLCRLHYQRRRRGQELSPNLSRICGYCDAELQRARFGPEPTYCSQSCKARAITGVVVLPQRFCAVCGDEFQSNIPHKSHCSERCRATAETRRYRERHGSPAYDEKRRAADQRRRARKRNARVETFTRADLAERDGWHCQLCDEPIDPDIAWPDPLSPSVDHVIPLARGGEHSLANTQLAHLVCNTRKGDKLPAGGATPWPDLTAQRQMG